VVQERKGEVTPAEKQAARDKIEALRVRWKREAESLYAAGHVSVSAAHASERAYLAALESLCDELTRPEEVK
jgi:hypothetical protein